MSDVKIEYTELDALRAELEDSRVDGADCAGKLREALAERDELREVVNTPELAYVMARRADLQGANMRLLVALKDRDAAVLALADAQATSERYRAERDALQQIVVKAMTERAADRKSRGGAAAIAAFRAATPPAPEQAGDGEQGR